MPDTAESRGKYLNAVFLAVILSQITIKLASAPICDDCHIYWRLNLVLNLAISQASAHEVCKLSLNLFRQLLCIYRHCPLAKPVTYLSIYALLVLTVRQHFGRYEHF